MGDTERRPATPLPWWVEAGMKFLQVFGFPAAVAAYVLVVQTAEIKAVRAELGSIRVVLEERLPKSGR